MPTDPWLWPTSPVPASRPAIAVQVARYDPTGSAGAQFQVLDNLECVEVAEDIGVDPGRASFRYRFDNLDPDAPQSIEQALAIGTYLPKTVEVNDQLVVKATIPGGDSEFLFWGKALKFGMFLNEEQEEVNIVAVGWAKGLWNTPMPGARIRDGSNPESGADYDSDIPAQFNPKGKPNATIAGAEAENTDLGTGDYEYPTFIDPLIVRSPAVSRLWTLAMACRYIIYRHAQASDNITLPTGDELDALLVSREPIDGTPFNPNDPSTFTTKDIIVSDRPLTGRDWPSMLNELIRDRGFGMSFDVGSEGTAPTTTLRLFLLQGADPKDVYLQARGSMFDPELSNLGAAEIERDCNEVVNQWEVVGALQRYEASFILAPGFPMDASDAETLASIAAFDKTAANFAEVDDAYRLFVYDETGEGHYAVGSDSKITTPGNLDTILGAPAGTPPVPAHATRRRKPIGELLSSDADGKKYRAKLSISTDSTQTGPDIWDGTGHWQDIDGGYELAKDRLGIRITEMSPNGWKIGKSKVNGAPYNAGVVKVIQALAATTNNPANPKFVLRLTCVIQGDQAVSGIATRSDASVLEETIARQIDARDRFHKDTVCASSPYNDGGDDIVILDDSDKAKAEAIANRVASESGVLDGMIEIPRLTRYYQVGDRIGQINGRDLGFRTDSPNPLTVAGAVYPVVIGLRHRLLDGQSTFLRLSDQDGHRHRIERKIRKG